MVQLYNHCDRGMSGVVWPDGGCVLDQPVALIEAFGVVGVALNAARDRARKADSGD